MPKLRNNIDEVSLDMIPSTRSSLRLSKKKLWEVRLLINGYELRSVDVFSESQAEFCCHEIRQALKEQIFDARRREAASNGAKAEQES